MQFVCVVLLEYQVAFDLFYFVIHCDFGVVDMVATTSADVSGKTAKFEETPPEVRTPENVEMRSASPLPTAGPSYSEAGPSNPGPRTPVAVAETRGQATTPNVYCHTYMHCKAPLSMTYFTGGRNLQSSFGINVAPGGGNVGVGVGIGGNDEEEAEEEEVEQRQVVSIGMFWLEDVTLALHHHLGLDGKLGLCPGNHGITNIKKLIKKKSLNIGELKKEDLEKGINGFMKTLGLIDSYLVIGETLKFFLNL